MRTRGGGRTKGAYAGGAYIERTQGGGVHRGAVGGVRILGAYMEAVNGMGVRRTSPPAAPRTPTG